MCASMQISAYWHEAAEPGCSLFSRYRGQTGWRGPPIRSRITRGYPTQMTFCFVPAIVLQATDLQPLIRAARDNFEHSRAVRETGCINRSGRPFGAYDDLPVDPSALREVVSQLIMHVFWAARCVISPKPPCPAIHNRLAAMTAARILPGAPVDRHPSVWFLCRFSAA
jgi:hypothetical protein